MKQTELEARKERGIEIAQTCRIVKKPDGKFLVPSQSGKGKYTVRYVNLKPICNCPDHETKKCKCKHIWAVETIVNQYKEVNGNLKQSSSMKITYSQNWSAYNEAQMKEKGMLLEFLSDLCSYIPNPEYSFGRPTMPMSDMIFSCVLKVFGTLSGRRSTTDLVTAQEKGYIDKVPHFNTIFKYLGKEELTPILTKLIQISALPLNTVETDFAVDSSGFSTCRFDRWYSFKYGRNLRKHKWLKAHICSGTKTNIITGVTITSAYSNDSPQFKPLVEMTAENFDIREVTGDKAYISVKNLQTVQDVGGTAYIPFRKICVSRAGKKRIWKKAYHFFHFHQDEFFQKYHKRSNVETTFHMIKKKFGDSLLSKNETAQINELLCKIICHNLCVIIAEMFNLGVEVKF